MSRVLVNGQDVNYTSDFPEMTYDKWKEIPEDLRPNYTVITDRDYTGEPLDNSVSVTADGVKTFGVLLNDLYALIDESKITRNTKIVREYNGIGFVYYINRIQSNNYNFTTARNTTSDCTTATLWLNATGSIAVEAIMTASGTTLNQQTSSVLTEGTTITLYYNIVSSGGVGEITADDVSYGRGSVADALDGMKTTIKYATVPSGLFSYYDNEFSVIGENVSVYFYATINGTLAGNSATICTLPDEAKIINTSLNNGTRKVVILGKYNNTFGAYVGQVRPNGTIITATGGGTFSGDIAICGSYVR